MNSHFAAARRPLAVSVASGVIDSLTSTYLLRHNVIACALTRISRPQSYRVGNCGLSAMRGGILLAILTNIPNQASGIRGCPYFVGCLGNALDPAEHTGIVPRTALYEPEESCVAPQG